jgi:hypothetical protein
MDDDWLRAPLARHHAGIAALLGFTPQPPQPPEPAAPAGPQPPQSAPPRPGRVPAGPRGPAPGAGFDFLRARLRGFR